MVAASAASGNVCALDHLTQHSILRVPAISADALEACRLPARWLRALLHSGTRWTLERLRAEVNRLLSSWPRAAATPAQGAP
jgi:hypothetical protein